MKLKINNFKYEILFVNDNDENLDVGDNDYRSGITDFRKKKIYIANNLNNDSYRYTLKHELTHAIIDSYGFLQIEWNDEIVADFMAIYSSKLKELLDILESKGE